MPPCDVPPVDTLSLNTPPSDMPAIGMPHVDSLPPILAGRLMMCRLSMPPILLRHLMIYRLHDMPPIDVPPINMPPTKCHLLIVFHHRAGEQAATSGVLAARPCGICLDSAGLERRGRLQLKLAWRA